MGTLKDPNSEIDEDAVHVVEGILRGGDWSRSKPQPDKVGLDMRVDLLEEHHPQISFYIQIKGMGPKTRNGKVQPIETRAGHVSKAIELEHLDYYMKLPVPVFLIVVDVVGRVAYYVHVQRYVLEELKGDDWRERLGGYKASRRSGDSVTPPTKTIRVPSKNVLSDTEEFKGVVRDGKGFMASLSVKEGIAYSEQALHRLDDRFRVTFIKSKDGECFQLDARETVEWKLRAEMTKEKFDTLFGKGLPIELQPGEITIEGSPLLERINTEGKYFQIKQEHRGFLNVLRLDGTGQTIARLEYLDCDIEGGRDEWRIKGRFPHDLIAIGFNLDLAAIRDEPELGTLNSTFTYKTDLASFRSWRIQDLPFPETLPDFYSGISETDRFRIELGIQRYGRMGSISLDKEGNELLAGFGFLYQTLHKARVVARFFDLATLVPDHLSGRDLHQIELIYGLIQGRVMPSPRSIKTMTVTIDRANLTANLKSFSGRDGGQISMQSEANFPFLGETVHVDDVVHEISNVKQLTRMADIKRSLSSGSSDIRLRFASTKESKHTVKLKP